MPSLKSEESCSQKSENSLSDRVAERVPLIGVSVTLRVVESQNESINCEGRRMKGSLFVLRLYHSMVAD
jgi:hypothetical protein